MTFLPNIKQYKFLGSFIFLLVIAMSGLSLKVTQARADNSYAILNSPWKISADSGAVEKYQSVDPSALLGKNVLRIAYNLHGLCLLSGDASAIIFDQPLGVWHYVSLSNYGKNCFDGNQTVDIPLSDFGGLNTSVSTNLFHVRFWYDKQFALDISTVSLIDTTPQQPAKVNPWSIQSVSSMKETKDRICNPRDASWIAGWVDRAKELGVNYVAVETPYDNPSCGSSLAYTKLWVDTIRSKGLKVWHRHMPLAFEGIYSVTKTKKDYLNLISNYIKKNPSLFASGDIFSPIPEPQNGGISKITYCAGGVCQFDSASNFNLWLRNAIDVSNAAFSSIGLGGKMKVGYYGFDGFVAWGSNNPDWHGILEDATVAKMGNITIDHYPEAINDTMENGLNELQAKYPTTPIIIGEWGAVSSTIDPILQVNSSMGAAKRPNVVGFNYWHMGAGGNEALINDDLSLKPAYSAVQSFFIAK